MKRLRRQSFHIALFFVPNQTRPKYISGREVGTTKNASWESDTVKTRLIHFSTSTNQTQLCFRFINFFFWSGYHTHNRTVRGFIQSRIVQGFALAPLLYHTCICICVYRVYIAAQVSAFWPYIQQCFRLLLFVCRTKTAWISTSRRYV